MALQECQWQIRDLVMGPGTPFQVLRPTSPYELLIRADQTQSRAWSHGTWSGAEWGDERPIPLRIFGQAASGNAAGGIALVDQVAEAFQPVGDVIDDVELRFAWGGREYVYFGRPRRFTPDTGNIRRGRFFAECGFMATDPKRYSGTLNSTIPVTLPSYVSGLSAPLLLPTLVRTVRVGGEAELLNEGTAPAGIRLRIDGPVPEPRVSVQHPDGSVNTLTFHLDLPFGQFLIVDTAARTTFLNGLPQASRRGQVTADPDWPLAQPGTNRLRFGAADDDTGTVTAEWRSAWW